MMLLKCYIPYVSKLGKLSSGHRMGKGQFSPQSQRRAMPKNVQTSVQLGYFTCQQGYAQNFSSQASAVYELRTSRCIKAEEPEIKLPTFNGKQGNIRKTSISASLTMLKPWTVWVTTNWKILKRDRNTRPPDLSPEKSVCR